MKKLLFIVGFLLCFIVVWILYVPSVLRTPGLHTNTSTKNVNFSDDDDVVRTSVTIISRDDENIVLDTLKFGDTIKSPFVITGKARGSWYFEGSFPVELRDSVSDVPLALQPATALADWMTNDWVPFSVTLRFSPPMTATGTLIFHKDNPSGDSANDKAYQVPVQF